MSQVIVVLALGFSVVIAIFAVQNTQAVDVKFLSWQATSVAASVLVLVSAALGALAMLLLGAAREVSLRWRLRSVSQQLKAAQTRVAQLEASQAPAAASLPTPAATDSPVAPTPSSTTTT